MSVYDEVTAPLIEAVQNAIDNGTKLPWDKPWQTYDDGMGDRNITSGKEYRGINIFITQMRGYTSPFWGTEKQLTALYKKQHGIKRDADVVAPIEGSGTTIMFWKWRTKEEMATLRAQGKYSAPCVPFAHRVFNSDQVDELEVPEIKPLELKPHTRLEACEKIVANMPQKPEIYEQASNRACYIPSSDRVEMPILEQFNTPEEYYSTLFHELVHSTGHEKRLKRKELMHVSFGRGHAYSQEELTAEFGAAMLCGVTGIEKHVIDNSAAYLQGWLSQLRDNPKELVYGAQRAQKAADYIRGIKFSK